MIHPASRRTSTKGFTLVELLAVVALIGVISAAALPGLMRARAASHEASAEGTMRAIDSGQHAFRFTCGSGRYSPSLQNLGLQVAGATGYISPDLSGAPPVRKSGYEYDLGTVNPRPTVSCNGGPTAETFHATASPLSGAGQRYFGSNGEGAIFQSPSTLVGLMPDAGTPAPPATPLQR